MKGCNQSKQTYRNKYLIGQGIFVHDIAERNATEKSEAVPSFLKTIASHPATPMELVSGHA